MGAARASGRGRLCLLVSVALGVFALMRQQRAVLDRTVVAERAPAELHARATPTIREPRSIVAKIDRSRAEEIPESAQSRPARLSHRPPPPPPIDSSAPRAAAALAARASAALPAAHGVGESAVDVPRAPESECLNSPEQQSGRLLSYDLVVLVLSSRRADMDAAERRTTVRRSWARVAADELGAPLAGASRGGSAGSAGSCSVRTFFVLGGAKQPRVGGDDLLLLPVGDRYRQISQKVIAAMRWVVEHLSFKYLLKTDDDSFVCLSRLLEMLRAQPRQWMYLGTLNKNHSVITDPRHADYDRWRDPDYAQLFARQVYLPYMQGAGYVLSDDLVRWVEHRAAALPRLPAMEDALVGALVHGNATRVNRPAAVRFKPQGDFTTTVCEQDTEFVILHKLSVKDMQGCSKATGVRRSKRCPRGPCRCRNLGRRPRQKAVVVKPPPGSVKKGRAASTSPT